jgi:hypothetical protein
MELPADQAIVEPSEALMGNGETYDFEFTPPEAGEAQIEVRTGAGDLLAVMPPHIRTR